MTPWIVVVAAGAGTWLFRVSMLVVAARTGLPPIVERAARRAVVVSFAALATGALADRVATAGAADAAVPLVAVAVAVVAVGRTGSPHAALVAGLPTAWLLAAVLGS